MRTVPALAIALGLAAMLGLSGCDSRAPNRVTSPGTSVPPGNGGNGNGGTGSGAVSGGGATPGSGLGTIGTGGGTGTAANALPLALADVAIVQVGSTGNPLDVLANDSDANGDALKITAASLLLSVPPNPTDVVTIASDGRSLRYTPPSGFVGTQTISYTISDGKGGVATATATVTVSPLKIPSVAVADAYTLKTDAAATTLDVLANDIDGAMGGLVVSAASSTITALPGNAGTVSVVSGALRYQPKPGFTGVETLSYTLKDANGATATTTVLVTVLPLAPPPVALPDTATAISGATVTLNVIANDVTLAGGTLTVSAVTATASVLPGNNGMYSIVNNQVRYTPPSATFAGTQTATYTITDANGMTATGVITIVVTPAVPPVPPVAVSDVYTRVGGPTSFSFDVLANDIDVANGGLTIAEVSVVAGVPDAMGVTASTDGKLLKAMLPATYVGALTLSYMIKDANGTNAVGAVALTVQPAAVPAAPPVTVPDATTIAQDSGAVSIDVLANDIDPAGGGLTLTAATTAASLPMATHMVAIAGNQVRFTPAAGFAGVVTINYTVKDANGTSINTGVLTITVNPKPLEAVPPVTVPDARSLDQNSAAVLIDVLANDVNAAGGTLTLSAATVQNSAPPATHMLSIVDNQVRFAPATGFVGLVTITYTATDPRMRSSPGTLSITVAAALPVGLP